jgi:hypothetical protein
VKVDPHPLGFTKAEAWKKPDGSTLRVHVWDDHLPDDIDIHQHRADFTSTVITGSMNEELWRYVDDPDGGWEHALVDCGADEAGRYHVDPRSPWTRCRIEPVQLLTHKAGETYHRDCRDLHRVLPVRLPLVTLVETGPVVQQVHTLIRKRKDRDHDR